MRIAEARSVSLEELVAAVKEYLANALLQDIGFRP